MYWIIQEDIHAKNSHHSIIEILERFGIPHLVVQVSNNHINPNIDSSINTNEIITNGSIMLSNIAKAKGWQPGSFFNENFSYHVWSETYKEFLLNRNATITKIKDAQFSSPQMFVRPVLDNKSFSGKVFSQEEFQSFKQKCIDGLRGGINPEIEILVSPVKKIGQEHRHYIVDGKVISSSRYKFNGTPNFKEGCDDSVLDVVYQAIEQWQPAQAFVLDTYIAGDEIGVVEMGSICHAGIYEADLMKIVFALDDMKIDPHSTS